MAVNIYNIKKWCKMLTGKSVLHVNQDLGKEFEPDIIKGYFNNMTEKVTKEPELLHSKKLPLITIEKGDMIEFPVAIFQYGLGAYDLFLQSKDEIYYQKFIQCASWALQHQEVSGAWDNFSFYYPDYPYGAMCQGEGASLLIRAYTATQDVRYLKSAKKAIDFMLLPIEDGGTTSYQNGGPCFLEYTHRPAVLNGWVFALFGLYDFSIACGEQYYIDIYKNAVLELAKQLYQFVGNYWSMYDLDGRIASPFYHNLHIAQMEALYLITKEEQFMRVCNKWKSQQGNLLFNLLAFIRKVLQKIVE